MRNLILILTVLLVQGCAVKAQSVSLAAGGEKPEVLMCGDAMQATLGIAPVRDERPAEEVEGKKPKGVFLLLWNQRKGDYVTSDQSFMDPLPKAMAENMAYAVARTNCFYETKIMDRDISPQPGPEELLVSLAHDKVDYILTTELEHFYGKQSQDSHIFVLPMYYVDVFGGRNDVGTAVGRTEMLLTLFDTRAGHEVWREHVVAESDSAGKGEYPKAARQAFLRASEKAANELYRFARINQGEISIPDVEGRR